jgi:hypothetical protein
MIPRTTMRSAPLAHALGPAAREVPVRNDAQDARIPAAGRLLDRITRGLGDESPRARPDE